MNWMRQIGELAALGIPGRSKNWKVEEAYQVRAFVNRRYMVLLFFSLLFCFSVNGQNIEGATDKEKKELDFKYSYAEGLREKMGGNDVEAIVHFKRCLFLDPHSAATNYELGYLHFHSEKFADANVYASQAWSIDPSNIWYGLLYIETAKQLKMFGKAAEIYLSLAEQHPDQMEFIMAAVETLIDVGEYKRAEKVLKTIEKEDRFKRWTVLKRVEILGQKGETDKAQRILYQWLKVYPDDIQMRGLLAESLSKYENVKKTLEQYEILKEKDPNNPAVRFSLAQFYFNNDRKEEALNEYLIGFKSSQVNPMIKIRIVLEYLGQQHQQDSLSSEVIQLLETLYQYNQGEPQVDALFADYLYNEGRFTESEKIYDKLIAVDPGNFNMWQNMLFIQNEKRDFVKMKSVAEKAIEVFPNQPLFYMMMGIAEMEANEYMNSIASLKKGLSFPSNNPELTKQFYISLGDAYHQMGNNEMAFSYFDDLLAIDPENIVVLNNYSYYLALENLELDKAMKMIEKCIKKEEGNPTYLDTYAWVLYKTGQMGMALEVIEKAIRLSPEPSGEVLEHYGDILYMNGRKDKAREVWVEAKLKGETTKEIDDKIIRGIL